MINNRQGGRRRGRGGGQRSQGGGQGQRDSGNRIDSRARGNASQLHEKYKNMAADAQRQGDRVNTEYYLQFADHYFRVMADQRGRYEDQNQQRRQTNDFDLDEEYGDEGEPIRGDDQTRGEGDYRGEQRNDYRGEQRDYGRRDGNRENGREQNGRDQGNRENGYQREDRDGGPRRDARRDRGPRLNGGERIAEGAEQNGRDRPAREERAVESTTVAPAPLFANDEQEAPAAEAAPKRRGRPRKQPVETEPGLDTSVLPPSLGVAPAAGDTEEAPAPKPRRRRVAGAPTAG